MLVSRLVRLDWRAPTTLLAAFLLFNQFVLGALSHFSSPSGWLSSGWQNTWNMLIARGGADSWNPMRAALEHLQMEPDRPLYSTLLFEEGTKFQYPPMSLPIFYGVETAVGWITNDTNRGLVIVGTLCLVAMGVATALILAQRLNRPPTPLMMALGVFAALTYFPLTHGVKLGQTQTWISLAFALSLLMLIRGQSRAAGVLVGAMCLIKPHYGLLVLWGGLRRDWDFVVSMLAVCISAALYSVYLYGFDQHFDYLNALSFLSRHGEAYYANQSVNGLLHRLYGLSQPGFDMNLVFKSSFPPYNAVVHLLTVLSAVIFLATGLYASTRDRILGFCIMITSVTMASPIAWYHHFGLILPVYAIAFAALRDRPAALAWLAASYVLTSHVWLVLNYLADTPANILQSCMFFGSLILLMQLHWAAAGKPVRPWSSAAARARSWLAHRPGMG